MLYIICDIYISHTYKLYLVIFTKANLLTHIMFQALLIMFYIWQAISVIQPYLLGANIIFII